MQTIVLFAIRRRPIVIQRRLQRLIGTGTAYITEALTHPDGRSLFPGGRHAWEEIYDPDLPICALEGYDILYKTASLAGAHVIFRRKKAPRTSPLSSPVCSANVLWTSGAWTPMASVGGADSRTNASAKPVWTAPVTRNRAGGSIGGRPSGASPGRGAPCSPDLSAGGDLPQ